MDKLRVYKTPSQIKFVIVDPDAMDQPMLSHAKRGDTFLREGAVCMRVDCNINPRLLETMQPNSRNLITNTIEKLLWVTNLQSGRTYASEDMPIKWVKLTVQVDGETDDRS